MPTYYITTLNFAIPFFITLIAIEIFFSKVYNKDYIIRSMDTLSSLCSGLTNIVKDVLGLTIIIVSYSYMVDNLAIFSIESSLLVYAIAFIGIDFAGIGFIELTIVSTIFGIIILFIIVVKNLI